MIDFQYKENKLCDILCVCTYMSVCVCDREMCVCVFICHGKVYVCGDVCVCHIVCGCVCVRLS